MKTNKTGTLSLFSDSAAPTLPAGNVMTPVDFFELTLWETQYGTFVQPLIMCFLCGIIYLTKETNIGNSKHSSYRQRLKKHEHQETRSRLTHDILVNAR